MPYAAVKPDANIFGVFPSALAQRLGTVTGDKTADALNQILLQMKSSGGAEGYLAALQAAQDNQLEGSAQENQTEIGKTYLQQLSGLADKGVAGALKVDNPYFATDSSKLVGNDAQVQQLRQSQIVQNAGAGVKSLADADMAPTPEAVGGMITPYLQETPTEVKPYVTVENKAKKTTAEAAAENAKAATYRAVHNQEGKADGQETSTYMVGPDGTRHLIGVTTKGHIPIQPSAPAVPKFVLVNGKATINPVWQAAHPGEK